MFISIFATVALCAKFSLNLIQDRKLPADYSTIDGDIRLAASDVAELSEIAELPLVEKSWEQLAAAADIYGFKLKAYGVSDSGQVALYTGPLNNWSGVVRGSPEVVLRVLSKLQGTIPIFLYDYKISGKEIFVNFSIVGT